jgi:hypothetical protein
MAGVEAIIGYAVGTFQVLFVDWWRRIAAHRRQLTLLQSELRRLRTYEAQFRWKDGLPPVDERLPAAPQPTELFVKTVGEIEWRMTDEHSQDNTQQSLLHIVDGCAMLKYYVDKSLEIVDRAPFADAKDKERLRKKGAGYAAEYDQRIDEILFLIDDALRDIGRRIELADFGRQMERAFGQLPAGANPKPLQENDWRVEEWRRQHRGAAS